jgi:hypothetical protein
VRFGTLSRGLGYGATFCRRLFAHAWGFLVMILQMTIRGFRNLSLRAARASQTLSQNERDILVDRARMRLLFLDTQFGQQVNDDAGLDFKFTCQLVNSNFLHRADY